jgi:hypothetical protein
MISNITKFEHPIKFLIYFFPFSFIIGNSAVNINVFLIILISGIYFLIFKKNLKLNNIIIAIFTFSFYLSCLTIFKILSSPSFSSSEIFKAITHLRYPLFSFFLYNIFLCINFDIKKIIYIYSLAVIILVFDLPFQYIFGFNIIGIEAQPNHFNSFFFDEKIAGGFILSFLFFLVAGIYLFFKDKKFSEVYQTLIIALSLIAIFLSQNKMSLLLSLFGLIIFSVLYKKNMRSIILSFFIFFSFLLIFPDKIIKENYGRMINNIKEFTLKSKLFTMYLNEVPFEEIKKEWPKSHEGNDQHYHGIGSGHAQIFSSSLVIMRENSIFGTGLKGYMSACKKSDKKLWCSTHPHNYYLDIAITSGLPGVLLISTIIFLVVKKFLDLRIFRKEKFNLNELFYLTLIVNFIIIFFPLKSSGSFFTTQNLSYIIFTISLISIFQQKIKK